MKRQLFGLAGGLVLIISGFAQAATYDNIYWVGPDAEWTGNVTASPEYSTGWWSTNPNAVTGLPAKFVLGRNDGIRVEQVTGGGGFDLDRVPCNEPGCTTGGIPGGTQLGTDIYINNGATVSYNPNRQFLTGDDGLDRFGDFRFHNNQGAPRLGTPTLNILNGSQFVHQTTFGGDIDGMWTRWNGADMVIDGAGSVFSRTGDAANGFASGAFMWMSYHGYANSSTVAHIQNGGRFENQGQMWFGISGFDNGEEAPPGLRHIVTIHDGHMDLTGGDEYALDNDNFLNRADLSFIYDWTFDDDPMVPATYLNNEKYAINFTGPGTITVDGEIEDPIDELDGTYTQAELDADFGAGRGGIRIAEAQGTGAFSTRLPGHAGHELQEYGVPGGEINEERNIQRSYEDLWNKGILRANNKSGLTGDSFGTYFSTTGTPGGNNYTLTSLLPDSDTGIPGDFNRDGQVDQADWVVYRKTVGADGWGDTATAQAQLAADADGNLRIDENDLRIWRENFGVGAPGSGGAVPEPGSMLLMLIGLASLSVFRKRAD